MGRPVQDLVGERFERWRVVAASERRASDQSSYWWCECECGTRREVDRTSLRFGRSRSCGCLTIEATRERAGELHPRWRGDLADYFAKHHWVNRHFAKTGTCEECGIVNLASGPSGTHWHNANKRYDRQARKDWVELCPSRHALTRKAGE